MSVKIISEIGINHNGDIDLCKKLIDISVMAGCDYVKFQKRTPDLCVPDEQKNVIRDTPWGKMKYIDYKKRIEFGEDEFDEIDLYCKKNNIKWFASVWDLPSVDFMNKYCKITKIPSALITDIELCKYSRKKNDTLIISTGMSSEDEIINCVNECNPDVIMHTNSTYPSPYDELNLNYILHLRKKFNGSDIGYSGHEFGLPTTFAAVALGAMWVERHITLDRNMWGSDHSASVEPTGVWKLVKGIRDIEKSMGVIGPRKVTEGEIVKIKSLRK